MAMIKPGQASEALNIPPSTLRRIANEFEDFISPQTGSHRSYTLEDLDLFRKIRDLLSHGLTYEEIKPRLQIVSAAEDHPQDKPKDLAIVPEIIKQLTLASEMVSDLQAQIEDLKNSDQTKSQEISELQKRLNTLEARLAWQSLPWFKKIFADPSEYFNTFEK